MAKKLIDRETLNKGFAAVRYNPPKGSYLLVARVIRSGDQLAFDYHTLGDGAFLHSESRYWPASVVKLAAAVGALVTLSKYGLNGDAVLSFEDDVGKFDGQVSSLYAQAIIDSNNLAYDRLVRIAGFDELNDELLNEQNGFPYMMIQRPYYPFGDNRTLRISPDIAYKQGDKQGVIPARSSMSEHPECPNDSNCITLFELLDLLRRVALNHDIPKQDRFSLDAKDINRIMRSLLKAKTKLNEATQKALGHPILVYNKSGRYPMKDQLDHALIIDQVTKARYLVAASVPNTYAANQLKSEQQLDELAAKALRIIAHSKIPKIAVRRNGGTPIEVFTSVNPGSTGYTLKIITPQSAQTIELWRGRELVSTCNGSELIASLQLPSVPEVIVIQVKNGNKIIGYRAVSVKTAF